MAYLNPRIFTREELVPVAAPMGTLTDLSAQAVTALPLDPIAAPAAESGTAIPIANSTPCDERCCRTLQFIMSGQETLPGFATM